MGSLYSFTAAPNNRLSIHAEPSGSLTFLVDHPFGRGSITLHRDASEDLVDALNEELFGKPEAEFPDDYEV
jgi:hypothetical protein